MSGHATLAILDALARSSITFISAPHEQLAVHAADGYFRATGRVGVVLTTLGPGIANTTAGLQDALQDCSGLLVLSGNVPMAHAGQDSYQEIGQAGLDQRDSIRAFLKRSWQVAHPEQLIPLLTRAYITAISPPAGPVMLDLPMDVMSYVKHYEVADLGRRGAYLHSRPEEAGLDAVVELLTQARRPVILAGGGVLRAGGTPQLVQVAEALSAPVASTLIAQSAFPNDHALWAGVSGAVGNRPAHWALANADAVLVLGSRLSDMDANSREPGFFAATDARIAQVDINAAELGRVVNPEVALLADAGAALLDIAARLESVRSAASPDWLDAFTDEKERWSAELGAAERELVDPITPPAILKALTMHASGDANIVAGIGPRYIVSQFFKAAPAHHFAASGSGTMGFAPPAALGIKLGRPDEQVVCFCGDGEFKSTSTALAMAVEYGINVTWIVLNNYSYNVIELYQNRYFDGRDNGSVFRSVDGELYSPDYAAMAQSYGVAAERVEEAADLEAAVKRSLNSGAPYLLEVVVTRRPQLRATGYWEANKYLVPGWNKGPVEVGGFGDSSGSQSHRREWSS